VNVAVPGFYCITSRTDMRVKYDSCRGYGGRRYTPTFLLYITSVLEFCLRCSDQSVSSHSSDGGTYLANRACIPCTGDRGLSKVSTE
jgi:hypothetical protein